MSSSRKISRKWLRGEVILLLELYHSFPILWDVHSSDNKKRNIQKNHFKKIQEGLSTSIPTITIEDIKEKMHKLRTQYQKERNRIKSSSMSVVGLNSVYKSKCWLYEKMRFLDGNEMKPSVSTLNEENEQSEITELDLNDVNTCVSENEIASGSDKISDDTSPVNDLDITPPQCSSHELTCGNISPKKRKLCDEFSTFIKK